MGRPNKVSSFSEDAKFTRDIMKGMSGFRKESSSQETDNRYDNV